MRGVFLLSCGLFKLSQSTRSSTFSFCIRWFLSFIEIPSSFLMISFPQLLSTLGSNSSQRLLCQNTFCVPSSMLPPGLGSCLQQLRSYVTGTSPQLNSCIFTRFSSQALKTRGSTSLAPSKVYIFSLNLLSWVLFNLFSWQAVSTHEGTNIIIMLNFTDLNWVLLEAFTF